MTKDEALRMALEALEKYARDFGSSDLTVKAMYVVRQALAQPEKEPVAYQDTADKCRLETVPAKGGLLPQRTDEEEYLSKAYRLANELRCHLSIVPAPQRTWVWLTDVEANELWESTDSDWELMKRTEAKLKEKNT